MRRRELTVPLPILLGAQGFPRLEQLIKLGAGLIRPVLLHGLHKPLERRTHGRVVEVRGEDDGGALVSVALGQLAARRCVRDDEKVIVFEVSVHEEITLPRERLHVAPGSPFRVHADAAGLQHRLLRRGRCVLSAREELFVEPLKPLADLHSLAACRAERVLHRPRQRIEPVRSCQPAQRPDVLLARKDEHLSRIPLAKLREQRRVRALAPIVALTRAELGDWEVVRFDPIGRAEHAMKG